MSLATIDDHAIYQGSSEETPVGNWAERRERLLAQHREARAKRHGSVLRRLRWAQERGRGLSPAAVASGIEGATPGGTLTTLRELAAEGEAHEQGDLWYLGPAPGGAPPAERPPGRPLAEVILDVAGDAAWFRGELASAVEPHTAVGRTSIALEISALLECGLLVAHGLAQVRRATGEPTEHAGAAGSATRVAETPRPRGTLPAPRGGVASREQEEGVTSDPARQTRAATEPAGVAAGDGSCAPGSSPGPTAAAEPDGDTPSDVPPPASDGDRAAPPAAEPTGAGERELSPATATTAAAECDSAEPGAGPEQLAAAPDSDPACVPDRAPLTAAEVRAERQARGWSLRELADLLTAEIGAGYSTKSWIWRFESGQLMPDDATTVERLAALVRVFERHPPTGATEDLDPATPAEGEVATGTGDPIPTAPSGSPAEVVPDRGVPEAHPTAISIASTVDAGSAPAEEDSTREDGPTDAGSPSPAPPAATELGETGSERGTPPTEGEVRVTFRVETEGLDRPLGALDAAATTLGQRVALRLAEDRRQLLDTVRGRPGIALSTCAKRMGMGPERVLALLPSVGVVSWGLTWSDGRTAMRLYPPGTPEGVPPCRTCYQVSNGSNVCPACLAAAGVDSGVLPMPAGLAGRLLATLGQHPHGIAISQLTELLEASWTTIRYHVRRLDCPVRYVNPSNHRSGGVVYPPGTQLPQQALPEPTSSEVSATVEDDTSPPAAPASTSPEVDPPNLSCGPPTSVDAPPTSTSASPGAAPSQPLRGDLASAGILPPPTPAPPEPSSSLRVAGAPAGAGVQEGGPTPFEALFDQAYEYAGLPESASRDFRLGLVMGLVLAGRGGR